MSVRQTTFESAGYIYDPFSTNSIFGQPNSFVNYEEVKSGMPKSHDDSMMPQFADARFQRDLPQGSSGQTGRRMTENDVKRANGSWQLFIFAAVVVVALYM